jgi:hypothetical protein
MKPAMPASVSVSPALRPRITSAANVISAEMARLRKITEPSRR